MATTEFDFDLGKQEIVTRTQIKESIYLFVYLSACMYERLYVYMSVCRSMNVSISFFSHIRFKSFLSIYLSILFCLCLFITVCQYLSQSLKSTSLFKSIKVYSYLSIYLSLCPLICLVIFISIYLSILFYS